MIVLIVVPVREVVAAHPDGAMVDLKTTTLMIGLIVARRVESDQAPMVVRPEQQTMLIRVYSGWLIASIDLMRMMTVNLVWTKCQIVQSDL